MFLWCDGFKEIEEGGLDISTLTQEDVFNIAKRLNVINNYRIFDGRRQLKSQIKDITLALNDKINGITDQLDLYGIVFDNYTRAFVGNRFEGSRKAIAVRSYLNSSTSYDPGSARGSSPGVRIYGEYVRSRNTSLNAQHTIEFQVGTGYIKRRIIGNVIYPFGFGKYQFDFFPNSRTKLSGFVTGYYSYEDYSLNNDAIVTPALSKLSVHSGLSTSYFINFRTRIQANFSILSFINNIENVNGRNHFSFDFTNNISFLHSIF